MTQVCKCLPGSLCRTSIDHWNRMHRPAPRSTFVLFQPDRDLIANAEGNRRILAADLAAFDEQFPPAQPNKSTP